MMGARIEINGSRSTHRIKYTIKIQHTRAIHTQRIKRCNETMLPLHRNSVISIIVLIFFRLLFFAVFTAQTFPKCPKRVDEQKKTLQERKKTLKLIKKIFDRRLNHMIVIALSASTDESDRVVLESN